MMENALSFNIQKKVFIIIIIYSWSFGGEYSHISILKYSNKGCCTYESCI